MKMVIDIPEELFLLVQDKLDYHGDLDENSVKSLMLAVDNGKALSKKDEQLIQDLIFEKGTQKAKKRKENGNESR